MTEQSITVTHLQDYKRFNWSQRQRQACAPPHVTRGRSRKDLHEEQVKERRYISFTSTIWNHGWRRNKLHPYEYRDYCKQDASRSLFVPGTTTILIDKKSVKIEGAIKSLDPICVGFAVSSGKHPYTCENCELHRRGLNLVMGRNSRNFLTTNETRVGKSVFLLCYAKITEAY